MDSENKNKFNTRKLIGYLFIIFVWMFAVIIIPSYALSLKMSFTSQAPFDHWVQPYADACEETSILMIDAFYRNYSLDKKIADYEIRKIIGVKNKFIGPSFDEGVVKIAQLINDFFHWEAKVVKNPMLEQMKLELDNGHPIILPANASILKNPHYTQNIDYHVLILSGYDETTKEFIAQDPGTSYGQNYRYSYQTVMKAMSDVPAKGIFPGQKAVVFTSSEINQSNLSDGDNDGLVKRDEIKYHTSLLEPDTDRDGFLDGVEIKFGYSPHVAEYKLLAGSVVRSAKTHKVYLLGKTEKFHIVSQEAFNAKGFSWSQVTTVSEKYLSEFKEGKIIQ